MVEKLFVSNIPYSCTKEELLKVFEQHGKVADVKICTIRQKDGQDVSRGFGFVEYAEQAASDAALAGGNLEVMGRTLIVKKALPPRPKVTAFVAGLAPEVKEDELKEYFAEFHPTTVRIIVDKDQVSKGFGFVTFADHESLVAACRGKNRSTLKDRQLAVKFARPSLRRHPKRFTRGSRRAQKAE